MRASVVPHAALTMHLVRAITPLRRTWCCAASWPVGATRLRHEWHTDEGITAVPQTKGSGGPHDLARGGAPHIRRQRAGSLGATICDSDNRYIAPMVASWTAMCRAAKCVGPQCNAVACRAAKRRAANYTTATRRAAQCRAASDRAANCVGTQCAAVPCRAAPCRAANCRAAVCGAATCRASKL